MERRRPAYQIIDGVPRCIFLNPDRLRNGLKFRAKKGDLIQATFPKSGTHWLLYITQFILRNGEQMTTYQEFAKGWHSLEYMDINDFSSPLPLRMFATHLTLDKCTMTAEGKYEFQNGTFEDFVDTFVSGNFGYGDYFEHVAAGYALREEPNVFFVTYEELKKNTREVALRLAHFLGEQYRHALEKDEVLLQELLQRSQPEYMRNVVVIDMTGRDNPQWNAVLSRKKVTCREGHGGDENKYSYVRVGTVGTWKEYFTPDLLRKMESRILDAEKQTSFMDLWKDIRAETLKVLKDTK
ncbi:hypothetical protein MTO96_028966 [Rhipicephalus appendiculatus]